jgi:hypothetical protein
MIAGVLVPGRGYGVQGPLFDLADEALRDLGAAVEAITWTVPDGLLSIGPEPFVRAHVAAALHRLTTAAPTARPVLIAKSLGSHAAGLAAERELPAVWLTPLLNDDAIVAAITRNPAPALLIGGTADKFWVPEAAAATGKTVLTVDGGDHGLRPPGTLRAYTDALGTVAMAMAEFLADHRDLGLSDRLREAVLAAVTVAERPGVPASRATAAITLRAALEQDPSGLSAGEAALLGELLDRLAD